MVKMKGQMVFEFIIAAVLFFAIILYVLNYLNTNVSAFSSDFYIDNLENKAVQISELLIHNKGKWVGGGPLIVGLVQEWPVLNSTKIQWLNDSCSTRPGYIDLLGRFDLLEKPYFIEKPSYNMKIQIKNETSTLLDCASPYRPELPQDIPRANIERFALSEDGSLLIMDVWVW